MSALVGLLVALAVVAAAGTGGRAVGSHGPERPAVRPVRRVPTPDLSAVLLGVCAQLRAGAAPGEAWARIVGATATGTATATATLKATATAAPTATATATVTVTVPGSVSGSVPTVAGLLAATSGPGLVRGLGGLRGLRGLSGLRWLHGLPAFRPLRWLGGRSDDGAVQRARAVQAAARLSEELGAPLAGVLERIASAVAADEEADGERRAALSGPRSTAQVLAWLPVLGVALGALLGADPVEIILAGGLGTASAVLGVVMLLLGRSWTAALLARAGRAGADPAGPPRAAASPGAASASQRRVSHRSARRSGRSARVGVGLRAVRVRP